MSEQEVLNFLNNSLRIELIVHLNGKMLHDSLLFKQFNLVFLSELTFLLKRENFAFDKYLFNENGNGDKLFYISKGTIILIHQASSTFIAEVHQESFIGELAFFSRQPRVATARSKAYTETLTFNFTDFVAIVQKFPN